MTLLLKGGRVVDPSRNMDTKADLLIEGEKIVKTGKNLLNAEASSRAEVLDVKG